MESLCILVFVILLILLKYEFQMIEPFESSSLDVDNDIFVYSDMNKYIKKENKIKKVSPYGLFPTMIKADSNRYYNSGTLAVNPRITTDQDYFNQDFIIDTSNNKYNPPLNPYYNSTAPVNYEKGILYSDEITNNFVNKHNKNSYFIMMRDPFY